MAKILGPGTHNQFDSYCRHQGTEQDAPDRFDARSPLDHVSGFFVGVQDGRKHQEALTTGYL